MKIFVVERFDAYCPENNQGRDYRAFFATKELAEKWIEARSEKNIYTIYSGVYDYEIKEIEVIEK